jgi:sugar/nucleoside kinase (ribokinase family)
MFIKERRLGQPSNKLDGWEAVIPCSCFVILTMSVLVVGSIAIDTVKTPVEEHSNLLGGSASYAALAASFFSPVRLVGVVGDDFPKSEFDFWRSRKIDTQGVQQVDGKTFRWSGEYSWDLNTRQTRSIDLNVFADFKPELPETYRQTDFVLLANIAPSLQAHVLEQMERPRFVVADTMDLWIETARPDLDALLRRVDLLILNDSEAREITKETSLIKAGRRIQKMGPAHVAIKKGEHGALLFGEGDQFFSCGAYPLEDIHDPTGAGDTFAGGMAGYLAGTVKRVHFNDLRKAMIYGSVLASFCVEAFSLERLRSLSMEEIEKRYEMFKLMSQFEVPPE